MILYVIEFQQAISTYRNIFHRLLVCSICSGFLLLFCAEKEMVSAPSDLEAVAVSPYQIDLVWSHGGETPDGFSIERKMYSESGFTEIVRINASANSYSNTGLKSDTLYYYRVKAYKSGDVSGYSNEASARTFSNSAPIIIGHYPQNDSTEIPLNTQITVTFDKSMKVDTITNETLYCTTSSGDVISGSVTYIESSKTASLNPTNTLTATTKYTVHVTTEIKDSTETPLAEGLTWSFTTAAITDTTPPIISSVYPQNNSSNVAATVIITAKFNEAMDSSTITANTFTLADTLNNPVTGVVTYDTATLTAKFTPAAALLYTTPYSARITTGAKDCAGNNLQNEYTWNFTTQSQPQNTMIIDHTCRNIFQIPVASITAAKATLHIAYGHTSHGQQLTAGMTSLDAFMTGRGYAPGTFAVDYDGTPAAGSLDVYDNPWFSWPQYGRDLGSSNYGNGDGDYTAWVYTTRKYLGWIPGSGNGSQLTDYATGAPAYNAAQNHNCNVIIWAWCGQVGYCGDAQITNYLNNMSKLETDYPQVKFVYMTGHLARGEQTLDIGLTGNVHRRNNMIRNYCAANNKILYDFEDIESYNPDGVYYGDRYATDSCNYDYNNNGRTEEQLITWELPFTPINGDRSWALDWQNSHTQNVDWYKTSVQPQHTHYLNANLKAYAAWWMWARIAGWDGP